jgi:hypothetical protein
VDQVPVNSAKELSELLRTLSTQFSNTHSPGAHGLWTQVDAHINHVMQEGGRWIDAEISTIERDWQVHRRAVQDAQHWFEHHVSLLQKVADDAMRLATEAFGAQAGIAGHIPSGVKRIWHDVQNTHDLLGHGEMFTEHSKYAHDLKWLDKIEATPVGKVIGGGFAIAGGIGIGSSAYHAVDSARRGHAGDAANSASDAVSSALKSSKNPVTYLAGVNVAIYTQVIDAATKIDYHQGLPNPFHEDNFKSMYVPAFEESTKKVGHMLVGFFT